MKPRMHPRELRDTLPARFDFASKEQELSPVPSMEPHTPVVTEKPTLQPERTPAPEGMNTPPGFDTMPPHIRDMLIANFQRQRGEGDSVETGEPMYLAWRMLKAVNA